MSEIPDKPVNEVPPSPARVPRRRARRPAPGILFPLLLIFIGVMLLLKTTGTVDFSLWQLLALWPVLLILIGLDILLRHSPIVLRLLLALVVLAVLVGVGVYIVATAAPEAARISLDRAWELGEADQGEVILNMTVGHLSVEALEGTRNFAEAGLHGWSADQEPTFYREGGVAHLEISQQGGFWIWPGNWGRDLSWRVALTPRVPLRIDLDTGVGENVLRLGHLRVEELRVDVGIGKVAGTLPGAGKGGKVKIHVGIGSVDVEVPPEVDVQIKVDAGLGSVHVDESRFSQIGDLYRSPGCRGEAECLDIEVDVGVGAVTVR